jgi:hypothetical protein
MAGVKAVGIAAFNSAVPLVKTATGVIDVATSYGVGTIARLEVKNTTINYVENGVSGGDNRSSGVTGNLPVILNVPEGADAAYAAMIEELLKGEVQLFIEKKNGTIVAAGNQNGALAVTADDQTGGTIGDLNGFNVVFQTMESDFSRGYILTGQALTDYAAALMPYV